jgi:hypothetical protein
MGNSVGRLFGGLTKTGVQSPGGGVDNYDSPAAAGIAMAKEAALANGGPSTSDIQGTVGEDQPATAPMANAGEMVNGPDNTTVRSVQPVVGPQPKMITPTFADANTNGGFTSPELSTKGKVLSMLLTAGEGAAAGAAASLPINGGRTGVGLGPAALAGFQLPFQQVAQRNELRRQQQDQTLRDEEIQNFPLRMAGTTAALAHVQSETSLNKARASLIGAKEDRSPSEVELALQAADPSDPVKAATAQQALQNLGKGKFANQTPKTYDELVLASQMEQDPAKKAQLDGAIQHIETFRARPTKSESQADVDRQTKRDTTLYVGSALAAHNGDEKATMDFLTRQLANPQNLSAHEREVAASAIMTLRRKPDPLADAINAALQKALANKGEE